MGHQRPSTQRLLAFSVLLLALSVAAPARAQETAKPALLTFTFERTPWRSVLQWLADTSDLALHVGDLPLGTFTYQDSRTYTPDEAINRINLFLIPQRYTLVRSHKLLSVVNLDDSTSVRQLDAMAVLVTVADLKSRGSHDLLKCLFPLGDIVPEHALAELSGLLLIREPTILPNTNQLLVTDTAGKLQLVADILATLEKPAVTGGPVKMFDIGTLDPERVLVQVRPHVGLDPLAMTGPDVSLSVDQNRGLLLASGSNENLEAIAGVLRILQTTDQLPDDSTRLEFRPHDIGEADLQTVVNVLHTLLADEDVRMAPDIKSHQIAIMAKPSVHDLVDTTIKELTGTVDAVEFKAIPVSSVDPRYAAIVLNEMFAAETDSADDTGQSTAPKIDADAVYGRLFVRAKRSQIEEIEEALQQLGQPEVAGNSSLRLLPYRGDRVPRILNSAQEFWPYADELKVLPSTIEAVPGPIEREIESQPLPNPMPPQKGAAPTRFEAVQQSDAPVISGDVLPQLRPTSFSAPRQDAPGQAARSKISVQQTPHGILVHSDDPEALKRFEAHVQMIAGPTSQMTRNLTIFYLKHSIVGDVNQLLQQLLDEEQFSASLSRLPGSSIVAGGRMQTVTDPLGLDQDLGMWNAGTATVIPDKRLNRLFVYGSAQDLAVIEQHLKVIDREDSIAQIQTNGTPHVIRLNHARADDVATIIRDAYVGRIAATDKERQQIAAAARAQRQQRSSAERNQDSGLRNEQDAAVASIDTSSQAKMTLAIDTQSNSLIVTAPKQLAAEVEELAHKLDEEGAQSVRVVSVRKTDTIDVHETLRNLFEAQIRSKTPRNVTSSKTGNR